MYVYRPSWGWRAANASGGLAFVGGGVFAVTKLVPGGTWLDMFIAAVIILFGCAWFVRVFQVQASYDSSTLYLRNYLRVLRIPRDQITDVDHDPRTAHIEWSTPEGKSRTATIAAVAVGTRYALPESTLTHQREFLRRVKLWAKRSR